MRDLIQKRIGELVGLIGFAEQLPQKDFTSNERTTFTAAGFQTQSWKDELETLQNIIRLWDELDGPQGTDQRGM